MNHSPVLSAGTTALNLAVPPTLPTTFFNKLSDMIARLAAGDTKKYNLVVIDQKYYLLTRSDKIPSGQASDVL